MRIAWLATFLVSGLLQGHFCALSLRYKGKEDTTADERGLITSSSSNEATKEMFASSEEGVSPYTGFLIFAFIVLFARTPLKHLSPVHRLFHRRLPFFENYSFAGAIVILVYVGLCAVVFFSNLIGQGSQSDAAVIASGKLALMNFWITLIPSSKNSVVFLITGVSFERSIKYHILTSALAFIAALTHGCLNAAYNYDIFFNLTPIDGEVIPLYGESL